MAFFVLKNENKLCCVSTFTLESSPDTYIKVLYVSDMSENDRNNKILHNYNLKTKTSGMIVCELPATVTVYYGV